jgi:hypothetical protein
MAKERSFEKLNYSLRPNKNVERKLMAEVVAAFGEHTRFRIEQYRYVGLSSIYFADAVLVHKRLGIHDIVSIEKEASRAKRLAFNTPYACVTVKIGRTGDVLPELDWAKAQIVWLDYDGQLDLSMFADVETVFTRLRSGDFVFVTVNAEIGQLQNVKQDETPLTPEQALRQCVPNESIPPGRVVDRLTANGLPTVVGEIWDNYMRSTVLASESGLRFVPLLNLTYSDGARMVTYGGVLLNEADFAIVQEFRLAQRFDFVAGPQFKLSVPQLTHKEKLTLDQLMPVATEPDSSKLPFELKAAEVSSYWKFYRHYPTFGEFAP